MHLSGTFQTQTTAGSFPVRAAKWVSPEGERRPLSEVDLFFLARLISSLVVWFEWHCMSLVLWGFPLFQDCGTISGLCTLNSLYVNLALGP